ncbi:MAG: hypothetical protein RI563_11720 [Thiohalophilus sp.]|uniref:phage adaptor protein n=1 Tax=Thiohalophilus sp. TaxID=3028392 RepID=UPI0028709AEF|nr:hypothetical protein [Thiohalophilus sp.]MDR9437542.1 hypothetical protein [Thiohalophilus sp.]
MTEQVRHECRKSSNASRGIDNLSHIQQVIRRVYEELYDDFDWPHMKVWKDKTINAGQRYYDFPSDLNLERTNEEAYFKYGSVWVPLAYGVDPEDYTIHNSDDDDRADPVLKWHIIDVTGTPQFEVWPLPASAGTVRFTGIKSKTDLSSSSAKCDLDSVMIVLFAAAEILEAAGAADARSKLAKAQARKIRMQGRTQKTGRRTMTGDQVDDKRTPGDIRISYTST